MIPLPFVCMGFSLFKQIKNNRACFIPLDERGNIHTVLIYSFCLLWKTVVTPVYLLLSFFHDIHEVLSRDLKPIQVKYQTSGI